MLETASEKKIVQLCKVRGKDDDHVQIPTLEKGTIIRVRTMQVGFTPLRL